MEKGVNYFKKFEKDDSRKILIVAGENLVNEIHNMGEVMRILTIRMKDFQKALSSKNFEQYSEEEIKQTIKELQRVIQETLEMKTDLERQLMNLDKVVEEGESWQRKMEKAFSRNQRPTIN